MLQEIVKVNRGKMAVVQRCLNCSKVGALKRPLRMYGFNPYAKKVENLCQKSSTLLLGSLLREIMTEELLPSFQM